MNEAERSQKPDQSEVFSFLADSATYGLDEPVVRIDTHGAAVFLAGKHVYKVKRAVHFPFMDFSTLEKRRAACESEIAVNKGNAPEIYLGVVPISRENSRLKLGSGSEIIEWAVHLRRFDENRAMDRLASRGELDMKLVEKLAEAVAASHRRAPIMRDRDAPAALRAQIEETMASLEGAPGVFPAGETADLKRRMLDSFERLKSLLQRREAAGEVRRCHGDLHLGNIAMINGTPVLFDALEFDERLATCDILYDLAFLLMDVWTRGLKIEANLLMNRYFSKCDDVERQLEALAALPLFLSLRAAIRAKVTNLEPCKTATTIAAARALFAAARAFFVPEPLQLVAVGGLSGTGKSSLARKIAPLIGRPPGAVHLRSDIERKRFLHAGEFETLPQQAYRPEISVIVYHRLRDLAATALAAGQSVVLDAAHRTAEERAQADIGKSAGARFTGLWLEAPTGIRLERVSRRKDDASDAGPEIAAAQAREAVGIIDWRRLDASQPIEALVNQALAAIDASSRAETPK
ncbi:AAA family ATPase [Methylocella tundrae]|uniref:Aminoglycoside phosphotransferase n=1 Tax=Methylocella tundrae TaxID=227605 RepID=A0A4U8YWM3_METTU|nr:AAA family ATPase [Methylocella tundrae]WPP05768.1 AAA family ATPase [Methylocella tundrae]VFU08267.1 Aminoglycoside phosphotransferase [Methylocella tundrae]